MSSLGLEQQQIERFLKIHFQCAYYSFFLIHLELKRQINAFIHSPYLIPVYTRYQTKMAQKPYP